MSWQFQEWKRFAGAAGAAAIVLAVAGMLVDDTPWFDRDPANYVTVRDDCEILGGFAERETAMADTTNFAPLAGTWWWGSFPERRAVPPQLPWLPTNWTTVASGTNAPGIYNTRVFWEGMEAHAADYFPTDGPRFWISTNAAGVVAAAGTLGEDYHDIVDQTNHYIMAYDWWRDNVYDGAALFPPVGSYVTTQQLACVQQSMAYCRSTLERCDPSLYFEQGYYYPVEIEWVGSTGSFNLVEGTPPPDWEYWGAGDDWPALVAGALTNMMEDAAGESAVDWSAWGCHGNRVVVYWECFNRTQSWLDGSTWREYTTESRYMEITQYVWLGGDSALVIGTNAVATGLGRPSRIGDDDNEIFWHKRLGYTEPTALLLEACTETVAAPNVRRVRDPWLAWDGHPDLEDVDYLLTFSGDFPPAEGTSGLPGTWGLAFMGWDQEPGQAGIQIDWTFQHMTTPARGVQ